MPEYKCSNCGKSGVKLWRTFWGFNETCFQCTCEREKIKPDAIEINKDGTHLTDSILTDQVGWSVPAVPSDSGIFYPYSSVPEDKIKWWQELPI